MTQGSGRGGPSAASSRAIAAPKPLEAPVTMVRYRVVKTGEEGLEGAVSGVGAEADDVVPAVAMVAVGNEAGCMMRVRRCWLCDQGSSFTEGSAQCDAPKHRHWNTMMQIYETLLYLF